MSKKTDAIAAELAEIAESSDFPDTLKTADLVGQTFTIESVRLVQTENGPRFVATISNGDYDSVEAWLSGSSDNSKLHRAVAALELHGFPSTVLLTKEDEQFAPYVLQLVV